MDSKKLLSDFVAPDTTYFEWAPSGDVFITGITFLLILSLYKGTQTINKNCPQNVYKLYTKCILTILKIYINCTKTACITLRNLTDSSPPKILTSQELYHPGLDRTTSLNCGTCVVKLYTTTEYPLTTPNSGS